MRLRFFLIVLLSLAALPLRAHGPDQLFDKLRLTEMIEIMRDEGIDYGSTLAVGMFEGGKNASWDAVVARIYDADRMEALVRDRFASGLEGVSTAPLLQFFESGAGAEIVALELSAREAMVDDQVEEAARLAWQQVDDDAHRLAQIRAFVEANDLIEANVAGALNASFKFYTGMVDGGGLEMTEGDILADVWSQEEETRSDTREWIFGFLWLAYKPLSDAQMQSYLELSKSPEGKAMNRALFGAFNKMYDDISYALGLAVAQEMRSEDL